jgi:PiT family inorganic phosphate transporter
VSVALVAMGAAASFAMGANDVANASGSFVMTGVLAPEAAAVVGGIGLAVGVLTWGRPLLKRVAFDLVRLDLKMAVAAQLAQAVVILVYVSFGYFTSMNQALVGGMIGVGAGRNISTVRWAAIRDILVGWGLGPPSGAALGFASAFLVGRLGLG